MLGTRAVFAILGARTLHTIQHIIHVALFTMNTPFLEQYGAVLARVLIALLFFVSGIGILMNLGGTAGYYASLGIPVAMAVAVVVVLLKIVGSLMVATGVHARVAAWGLIVFTVLATLLAHTGEGQLMAALKNLSVIGGLLLVALGAADTMTLEKYLPWQKSHTESSPMAASDTPQSDTNIPDADRV